MVQVKNGDTIKVHYTGKFENGRVFDSTEEKGPFQFTLGEGKVIPGFEKAVIGMSPGESKTVKISPEDAYGPHLKQLVVEFARSEMPKYLNPKEGQMLQLNQPDGKILRVMVAKVTESKVTLDGNHPLAGKELTFEIRLVEIV